MNGMQRSMLLETLKQFGGQANNLVVPKSFVQFTGTLEAGMMLSQLLYWSERCGGRKRIYKTDADWASELCLKKYGVRQARAALETMGVLKTEVHRANGVPTVHYYLQEEELEKQWIEWVSNFDFAKSQERFCESDKSLTETTTETTTAQQAENPLTSAEETLPVKEGTREPEMIESKAGTSAADEWREIEARGATNDLPPRGELSAGVADPQTERKQFIAEYQPKVARLYRLDEDATTARSIAAKLYDHRAVKKRRGRLDEAIEAVVAGGLPREPFMLVSAIVAKLEVKKQTQATIKVVG